MGTGFEAQAAHPRPNQIRVTIPPPKKKHLSQFVPVVELTRKLPCSKNPWYLCPTSAIVRRKPSHFWVDFGADLNRFSIDDPCPVLMKELWWSQTTPGKIYMVLVLFSRSVSLIKSSWWRRGKKNKKKIQNFHSDNTSPWGMPICIEESASWSEDDILGNETFLYMSVSENWCCSLFLKVLCQLSTVKVGQFHRIIIIIFPPLDRFESIFFCI